MNFQKSEPASTVSNYIDGDPNLQLTVKEN